MTSTFENRHNNTGRRFTPVDPDMIEDLRADGHKIYMRCCEVVGYQGTSLYYVHVEDWDFLYWVNENTAIGDLL
jgi:hypothetical protein